MTNISVLPPQELTREQQKVYEQHADQMQMEVSITGKTLSLLLQIAPEGVPENRRDDLERLQLKALKIYERVVQQTLEEVHPPYGGPPVADAEADDLPQLNDEELKSPLLSGDGQDAVPDIEMPDFDGPTEQAIPSLGSEYHWKRTDSGHGNVWELADVSAPEPRPEEPPAMEAGHDDD